MQIIRTKEKAAINQWINLELVGDIPNYWALEEKYKELIRGSLWEPGGLLDQGDGVAIWLKGDTEMCLN